MKKYLRKKRRSSSSTGSGSSGSKDEEEESSLGSGVSEGVFEETHKVRLIAQKGPGILTAGMIREMQKQMLNAQGSLWDQDSSAVPPLALQYYRQKIEGKMSGGMARECLTLSWALDQMLQGKIAAGCDTLSQRIKSLQMTAGGATWTVSQRLEVTPPEREQLSSRAEATSAARENREEEKMRRLSKGKDSGRGEGFGSWKGKSKGEGKDKGKSKGKKGEKEDQKK